MAELSAVPFSALPQTSDGYTVLYENNQVCRSEKKLSELVGDKTSSFLTREEGDSLYQEKGNYLVADDITGKLDKSQYAVDSATFLTAHQDISNKLDTTAFSTVSGNFLTAHQNLDEYATQKWVNNQGFLKEHQPISADEWNDVYETVVSNSGTWKTETDWTDDINDASAYAYEQAIAQIPAPFDPTFLSGEIDKKLDKTFSSNFYPMTGNPSGFLTAHQDISTKLDTTSFSEVSGSFLTAHQDISNKMDKSESANFYPMTGNPSGFLTAHQDISTKLDESAFSTVSSNFLTAHQSLVDYATIDYVDTKIGKIGSFEVVGLNEENVPDVNEPSTKIIYLTKETDSEKTDPYTEWIYNDTTSAWECIGETTLDLTDYYKKTETSGASEISDALDLKEDKVFVAEYNVTTYQEIKDAYDAGKQIVCKYYRGKTTKGYANLAQFIPEAPMFTFGMYFTDNMNIALRCWGRNPSYWTKTEKTFRDSSAISGSEQLSDAFNAKQDKLNFEGENNTITAINSSAIGGGSTYTAGTDLEIVNDVIGVRTDDCTANSAEYAFVEGSKNSATGYYAHAEGKSTSADGNASHTEGYYTNAIGTYSHSEGQQTTAQGEASHAAGKGTIALYNYETVVGHYNVTAHNELPASGKPIFVVGNGSANNSKSDAFIVGSNGVASATNLQTSAGYVVTDVMLTSATNSSASFVTNGVADLTPLYTYIKSLEDRIAALEAAQGGDGFTVNGIQPTVNGNTITVGE